MLVKLKAQEGNLAPGTEVEVRDVTDGPTVILYRDGKQVELAELSFDDFSLCIETFAEVRKRADALYKLSEFCLPVRKDLAEKYAARGIQLDTTFHGDPKARLAELTNPTFRFRDKLLASGYFDAPADAATGPRARLLELAKHPPANKAELKKAYLELQEARVFGTAKVPLPESSALTAVERAALAGKDATGHPLEKLSDADAAELKAWFAASPSFREHFLLALEPGYDFYQNAARIALRIKAATPKDTLTAFEPLLLAIVTTWDDPAIVQPRDVGIPELLEKPAPACTPEEVMGWYVKNQAKLCPWFKQTPWRLLAYVAADTAVLPERDWALTKYPFNPAAGKCYADVKYDMSKLQDMFGKLAGHPYTLENLKTYGGVCRDQAFYARSVCRYLGMPSYWASGFGRTGGMGHAWVGWVTAAPGGGFQLNDFGRYADDKFFTALITHPRTGEQMFDYMLSIEVKGLSNEKTFNDADLLYQVFEEVGAQIEPKVRYELLIDAVRTNPFHRRAWLALADGTASGAVAQSTAAPQWEYLTAQFKDTPDFTLEVLSKFARMFTDAESGYKLYDSTAKLYFSLKREDLAAKLRLDQVDLCLSAGKKDGGFTTALRGLQECAGTGKEDAALADKAATLAETPAQKKQFIDALKSALSRTPKLRIDEPNEYWIAMATLLRDMYRATGEEAAAARMDTEIKSVGVKR